MKRPRVPRTLLITAAILLAVELAVRAVAPSLPAPVTWSSEEQAAKVARMQSLASRQRPATVFVGSSVADIGIDPATFASSSYNAGLRGSSMEMIDLWTRLVVVPRLRPSTVVIGLSSREMTPKDPQQRKATRDFLSAPAVRSLMHRQTIVGRIDRRVGQISSLYRYRTVLRRPLLALGRQRGLDSGVVLTGAGWDRSSAGATFNGGPGIRQFLSTGPLGHWELGSAEVGSLRSLLAFLRDRHIKAVVVAMPVTEELVSLHPHGRLDVDRALAAMRDVAAAGGARFVDEGVWESRWFSDPIHLNGSGAIRLGRLLAGQLSARRSP